MKAQTGELISDSKYLRERLEPLVGDKMYLHLSDLRIAMKRAETDDFIRILDFGCGGSPYRSLFPNAEYVRADIEGTPNIDVVIDTSSNESSLPIGDESFDIILSSQVLEHVSRPEAYLQECWRLLRPNGRLILTTHGFFEDHGCPFDFFRWTSDGLRSVLIGGGFSVSEVWKLTTGMRAMFFLLEQSASQIPTKGILGLLFRPLKYLLLSRPWIWHKYCDKYLSANRFVLCGPGKENNTVYVGVGAIANKRQGSPIEKRG